MPIDMETREKNVGDAKKRASFDYGGEWYARTTYTVNEPRYKIDGWVHMIDVVGNVCISDYYWKKGTATVQKHEPHSSIFGYTIGATLAKKLRLINPTKCYVRVGETHIMLEQPIRGRDYGKRTDT